MNYSEIIATLQNLIGIKPKQREIADILGIRVNVIGQRASRQSNFSAQDIKKIGDFFGVDLLHNKTFDRESHIDYLVNDYSQKNNKFNAGQDDIIADYFFNTFGSCGNGAFVLSDDKEKIRVPKVIIEYFSPYKQYSVINAVGDSMLPYINDKDKLIVEHWNGEQIKDNRIYVFRFGDNIFVKRLILNIKQIIIKSDNPEYKVMILDSSDLEQFEIIGQIVGLMRNTR